MTDPLEAARMSSPEGSSNKDKKKSSAKLERREGESQSTTEESRDGAADSVADVVVAETAPTIEVAPPTVSKATHFTVVEKKMVSWGHQTITLHKGQVVSDESYGPNAVARMRELGVVLEAVA